MKLFCIYKIFSEYQGLTDFWILDIRFFHFFPFIFHSRFIKFFPEIFLATLLPDFSHINSSHFFLYNPYTNSIPI